MREAEREVEGALAARVSFVASGSVVRSTAPQVEVSEEEAEEAQPEDRDQALTEARRAVREMTDARDAALVREARYLAREEAQAQREARDLALAQLWSLTHRRLDLYHEIATNQARRSFTSAQVSMGIGFGLLVLFVALALNVSDTTGAIVTGGLGAVSAALAGFISKTFVTSQQTAAGHLKAYFDQPLEFSRYLAAERLLTDAGLSEEKRAEVVAVLVQTVAAGPVATAPVDAGGATRSPQDPPA
ncbi:TRADD-N-associated membrane domain-containing protein [Streptomyces phaeochromogenes]|uniref:TRADD-N-associated membrane domain-containing protein n=1 Tax=Streptomyces phaeochromogenes TaxID=1923 RepID=UPI00371FFF2C